VCGTNLANDDAAAIVHGFFQVFQQRVSMHCGVPYDSIF